MQVVCPACSVVLEYSRLAPRFCSNCGTPLSTTTPRPGPTQGLDPDATAFHAGPNPSGQTPLPECIGGYRLLRSLGTGGMGTVYEGEELATGRRVALKLI